MLRRNIILGGANLLALAGSADVAAAASSLPVAEGLPGDRVSAEDYVEIFQLYNRYCHAFDMGAGEAWADMFTEDGEFTGGRAAGLAHDDRTPVRGRANLVALGNKGGTRHFTANLVITKTPEGAKGSCYLLMYTARTTPDSWVEIAIYDDTLVKTPRGWKFKKRVVWRDDDDITPFKPGPAPK